ncbi:hypothetical protein ACFHW0_03760 [Micromonospora sp. LOL_025]|uniref:hypothetical protein n=1 Tax=Micromonospora sp. LOL_025 TaxID=3345413 RepID=UPI003A8B8573
MRRILVVGSAGAGKSTLSHEVARRLDLPLIHLDRHYWQPGWVALGDARWRATVALSPPVPSPAAHRGRHALTGAPGGPAPQPRRGTPLARLPAPGLSVRVSTLPPVARDVTVERGDLLDETSGPCPRPRHPQMSRHAGAALR